MQSMQIYLITTVVCTCIHANSVILFLYDGLVLFPMVHSGRPAATRPWVKMEGEIASTASLQTQRYNHADAHYLYFGVSKVRILNKYVTHEYLHRCLDPFKF